MVAKTVVEHKDIVAISPMATFDPANNELTVKLLLRKDIEFDPLMLKLNDGTQDYIYSLAVQHGVYIVSQTNNTNAAIPDVNTVVTTNTPDYQAQIDQLTSEKEQAVAENEKLQQELEEIRAMLEAATKPVEAPNSEEGTKSTPESGSTSVGAVDASQGTTVEDTGKGKKE
jgi:hypothetical protein